MPRSGDHNDSAPKLTPTSLDPVNPFESTNAKPGPLPFDSVRPRETQLSDPPTTLVRRDGFVYLPAGSIVGDVYEIDARLGEGAMGEVYAAHHIKLGKRVAIKMISEKLSQDAAAIERFAMEARTLAQIQHPAIVAVEHVGDLADGRAYFVMEYLRGQSLFDRLSRGRIPLPEALRILDQMARGLDAAHGEGIIHRDLKPENTFLVHLPGEESAVKLLDFGLAKLRVTDDRRAERTQSGVAIGTPMYMSPEQCRGPDVDRRTDIYALGCIAYELLLGVRPFPHLRTAPELYAAHLHETPPLPRSVWPEIPPQLDLVLFAMLAKDPAYRPTLAQVRSVIADVRTATPSQRVATEFVGQRLPQAKSRAWISAIAAVLTLAFGIAIGALFVTRTSTHTTRSDAAVQAPVALPMPTQPPQEDPVVPAATPDSAVSPPRSRSRSGSAASRSQKAGSAVVAVPLSPPPAVDAGIDAAIEVTPEVTPPPKAKTPPWTDRNQTINPFTKRKVTP